MHRQLKLPNGIADLVGISRMEKHNGFRPHAITVVEVKNVPINSSALGQVCRYAYDVEQVVSQLDAVDDDYSLAPSAIKVVIGPSIDGVTFSEAVAMDITVMTFAASLELDLGGQQVWRDSYRKEREKSYEELAASDTFSGWADKARKSLIGQIPEQYRDIVKR